MLNPAQAARVDMLKSDLATFDRSAIEDTLWSLEDERSRRPKAAHLRTMYVMTFAALLGRMTDREVLDHCHTLCDDASNSPTDWVVSECLTAAEAEADKRGIEG